VRLKSQELLTLAKGLSNLERQGSRVLALTFDQSIGGFVVAAAQVDINFEVQDP
jgi:hypothetical protein